MNGFSNIITVARIFSLLVSFPLANCNAQISSQLWKLLPDSVKPVNPKALKTSDIRKILEDRTLHNQYKQTAVKKEYELLANRLTAALATENNKKGTA